MGGGASQPAPLQDDNASAQGASDALSRSRSAPAATGQEHPTRPPGTPTASSRAASVAPTGDAPANSNPPSAGPGPSSADPGPLSAGPGAGAGHVMNQGFVVIGTPSNHVGAAFPPQGSPFSPSLPADAIPAGQPADSVPTGASSSHTPGLVSTLSFPPPGMPHSGFSPTAGGLPPGFPPPGFPSPSGVEGMPFGAPPGGPASGSSSPRNGPGVAMGIPFLSGSAQYRDRVSLARLDAWLLNRGVHVAVEDSAEDPEAVLRALRESFVLTPEEAAKLSSIKEQLSRRAERVPVLLEDIRRLRVREGTLTSALAAKASEEATTRAEICELKETIKQLTESGAQTSKKLAASLQLITLNPELSQAAESVPVLRADLRRMGKQKVREESSSGEAGDDEGGSRRRGRSSRKGPPSTASSRSPGPPSAPTSPATAPTSSGRSAQLSASSPAAFSSGKENNRPDENEAWRRMKARSPEPEEAPHTFRSGSTPGLSDSDEDHASIDGADNYLFLDSRSGRTVAAQRSSQPPPRSTSPTMPAGQARHQQSAASALKQTLILPSNRTSSNPPPLNLGAVSRQTPASSPRSSVRQLLGRESKAATSRGPASRVAEKIARDLARGVSMSARGGTSEADSPSGPSSARGSDAMSPSRPTATRSAFASPNTAATSSHSRPGGARRQLILK